jgi:hypothetical protein
MENKTKSQRIAPLLFLYDVHTSLFPNVIADITDKDAHSRLNTKANHVAWLTGSLVFQRAEIANLFGGTAKMEAHELFEGYKGIQDGVTYPSLQSFKTEWERISPVSREALVNVTDEKLDTIFEMDGMKMPYFDVVAFHVHREAYVIGQIGLWRRILGYEAMKYTGM